MWKFLFSPQDYTEIHAEIVSDLRSLGIKSFNIHNCGFTDDAFELFCDLVKTSTSLTSLDLSYCDLSYADLLRIITSIRNVSSLSVRKVNFGKQRSVKALADLLEENTTLSKIDLWGNSISKRNALELLKILKLNSTIECINLGNIDINEITGQDINTISNGRIAFLTT
ncbi:hypothetical protein GEMRC1_009522 [Eukaryota sp. GEM-RC1]